MLRRKVVVLSFIGACILAGGAVAQHEGHHPDSSAPAANAAAPMAQMVAEQKETAALVDQLAASFAMIVAEKDPEALKLELAEHGRILADLQTRMQNHSRMMEKMGMMHPMMENGSKK